MAIPILVLVLIAIPSWNYISRRREQPPARHAKELPKDLAVRTEGFTFSRTVGGKTRFTIHAKTNLGFKDSRNMLEDVDVTVYGNGENEAARRIRSRNCTYDEQTKNIRFEGNVEVELNEKTLARSEELTYNERDRIVASSQDTTIEQAGSLTGRSKNMEYALDTGVLQLGGGVAIHTAEGTLLETGSAVFQEKENWATVSGGVSIKSAKSWIQGRNGRVDLEPGTYRPKIITIEGDITGESRAETGGELWKLRAGWIQAAISRAGNAERVLTRGNVQVEKVAGNTKQILTGGQIDATLDSDGKVNLMEAHQDAEFIFGSDRVLRSSSIYSNVLGAIETADSSLLQVGDATVEGRQFKIQQGDVVTFNTASRATLRSGERLTSADRTEARFDSRNNSLLELVQTGNFQFREGSREGRSQNARFEDGGAVVTLDGSPVVSDPQMRLEAGQIRLNQKENSFVATRNVKTVSKNSGDPLLVTAARAQGDANAMLYTGNVQLWRGNAYIKADRLEASSDNRLHAEGKVQSNLEAIHAQSDMLDYNEDQRTAHYAGNVRAQKQDMILQARDMTAKLREKDVQEIVATDGVVVTQSDRRGIGDKAVYDASAQSVTLTGKNAEVHDKEHGTVRGTRLIMKTTGETMVVEGGVGDRSVTKHTVTK